MEQYGVYGRQGTILFNNKRVCVIKINDIIKSFIFMWFKYRNDRDGVIGFSQHFCYIFNRSSVQKEQKQTNTVQTNLETIILIEIRSPNDMLEGVSVCF